MTGGHLEFAKEIGGEKIIAAGKIAAAPLISPEQLEAGQTYVISGPHSSSLQHSIDRRV